MRHVWCVRSIALQITDWSERIFTTSVIVKCKISLPLCGIKQTKQCCHLCFVVQVSKLPFSGEKHPHGDNQEHHSIEMHRCSCIALLYVLLVKLHLCRYQVKSCIVGVNGHFDYI